MSSSFSREGRVFGELAQAALAGVDLGDQLIGVGDGGVQVVVERVVFEQLAGAALALVQIGGDLVEPVDGGVGAGVERVVGDQLASEPLPLAMAPVMVCRSVAMRVILWSSSGSLISSPAVPFLELSESTRISTLCISVVICSMETLLVRITS